MPGDRYQYRADELVDHVEAQRAVNGRNAAKRLLAEELGKSAREAQLRVLDAAIAACPVMHMGIKDKLQALKVRVYSGEVL
jgi:hypothetical protein